MMQELKNDIDSTTSEYDFSLECPEFRGRLFTKFIKWAAGKEIITLSDEELNLLNAAGQQIPPVKP